MLSKFRRKRGIIITAPEQARKYNMLARRRFLSLFAATPIAAKAAADKVIAEQAGVSMTAVYPPASLGGVIGGPPEGVSGQVSTPYIPHEERIIRTADWVKVFGLPEVIEHDLRQRAKWLGGLDPDLAAKRSWSMSVKMQEQRQRN